MDQCETLSLASSISNLKYPYLGVSYVIKNSPYPEVILRPRLEAENESKATVAEGHVVIAQESGRRLNQKTQQVKNIQTII